MGSVVQTTGATPCCSKAQSCDSRSAEREHGFLAWPRKCHQPPAARVRCCQMLCCGRRRPRHSTTTGMPFFTRPTGLAHALSLRVATILGAFQLGLPRSCRSNENPGCRQQIIKFPVLPPVPAPGTAGNAQLRRSRRSGGGHVLHRPRSQGSRRHGSRVSTWPRPKREQRPRRRRQQGKRPPPPHSAKTHGRFRHAQTGKRTTRCTPRRPCQHPMLNQA